MRATAIDICISPDGDVEMESASIGQLLLRQPDFSVVPGTQMEGALNFLYALVMHLKAAHDAKNIGVKPIPKRKCIDGGTCLHDCKPSECFRQECCAPLSGSGYDDNWQKIQEPEPTARQCPTGKPCQHNCPPTECCEDCNPPGEPVPDQPSLRDTLAMHAPVDFTATAACMGFDGFDGINLKGGKTRKIFLEVMSRVKYEYADAMLEARKSGTNTD